MLRALARVRVAVEEMFRLPGPPVSPAFALVSSPPLVIPPTKKPYGVSDMVNDMRILLGVPKYRTSKPKKVTRKFSYTRLLSPVEDLVSCQTCGNAHEPSTICGNCYEKVREVTNEIKRKMMDYNPAAGEKQDKEVHVKFSDDQLDDGVLNGKRVIELDRPRPTWFKTLFR